VGFTIGKLHRQLTLTTPTPPRSLHDFGIQCQAFQLVSFCEHYHRNSSLDGAEAGMISGGKQEPLEAMIDSLDFTK